MFCNVHFSCEELHDILASLHYLQPLEESKKSPYSKDFLLELLVCFHIFGVWVVKTFFILSSSSLSKDIKIVVIKLKL